MVFIFIDKSTKLILYYNVMLTIGVSTSIPRTKTSSLSASVPSSQFTFSSVRDSVLPAIQPLVAAGSKGCGSIKTFLGLTYNQMQAKNTSLQENINIDLITKNGNIKYDLKTNRVMKRIFHQAERIVVLIHGFMESSEGEMVQAISTELLKQHGLKIFALDGRKTINLEYLRSSTHAQFMGELLGNFLSKLVKDGQDPANISLIGHSLGAHIAGVAGNQVFHLTGKRVGKITGLDPAGPCFNNVTFDEILDKSDAEYVDVIHTNGGILGFRGSVGHKDFYPNGGSSQAGCYFYVCDHSRAWEYYAESINTPHAFPAQKCGNWTLFLEGKCKETSYMGVDSRGGSDGNYYLLTKPSKPYGFGNIHIT